MSLAKLVHFALALFVKISLALFIYLFYCSVGIIVDSKCLNQAYAILLALHMTQFGKTRTE